jgi:hypothetical protein
MITKTLARVGAPALALLMASPVFAQGGGMPAMPKPEEIQKKAQELLSKCETQTSELEGVCKITYKAIPSSSDEIGKLIGDEFKGKIPKDIDVDAALKQYGPQIQEAFNTYLTEPEGWKFEALVDMKWKSKKIPKGEYKVSLEVDGESLKSMILTQGEKGKKGAVAIPIHFKADKAQAEPFKKLKLTLVGNQDKKTQKTTTADVKAEFFRTPSKTTDVFKFDPPKDPPKDTPKDDPKK